LIKTLSRPDLPDVARVVVLAIAYHNIGVEYEFLKKQDKCLQAYRKGVLVAEKHLGEGHGMTVALRKSFLAANQACAAQRKGKAQRKQQSSVGGWSHRIATQQAHTTRNRNMSDQGEARFVAISNAYTIGDDDAAAGRGKGKRKGKVQQQQDQPAMSPRPGGDDSTGEHQSESKEVEETGVSVYRKGIKVPDKSAGDGVMERKYMMVQVIEFQQAAEVKILAHSVTDGSQKECRLAASGHALAKAIAIASIEEKWELASVLVDRLIVTEEGGLMVK
jgi:hypothetical protein